ncbi:MAG: efflux RND transporter periplasmic adaptor subunit [Proteobacteria bacterium]|nr:efflux RND transporter periplasmic adaptor subunit [Pseudomonadota bacterium]MBU1739013.1 efflux RND transporter periplasmic adaptor subunit [Pseudomonadota bacterium]
MKNRLLLPEVLLLIVLIAVAGFPAFAQAEESKSENGKPSGPPPAKVVVSKISRQQVFENNSFIGTLYYDRTSHVSSEVSGLVETVAVKVGDLVKRDAQLIRIDTEMLGKEIDLKHVDIEKITLKIENAEKNYRRQESLFEKDGVSEKLYDDARFTYQDSLKEKQTAELELSKLLLAKKKSIIRAPYPGVILEKNVDSGDWVQQGRALVRIASTEDLYVRVPVSENLLTYFKAGQEVPVRIIAYDKEVPGIIEDYDPVADAQTKNVFLKVKIPAQEKVAENMSASVYVPTSEKKELAIIPRDALIKMQGQDFVYTVQDDKAAIMPVRIVTYLGNKIGADNPSFTEGMVVVVEGNERLRPDQPVVVAGEK